MPDQQLEPIAYHVLRYTPNLVRDEWINVGVLVHDPHTRRARLRMIEEANEFARLRRLHPDADESLLRGLQAALEAQFAEYAGDLSGFLATLDQTLSNALQFSPQKGVLAGDLEAELERLYETHVEPPRYRRAPVELPTTRNAIRAQMVQVFRSAGILARMERAVRVEQFTSPGDPMLLDLSYRRNGTRGFLHALSLSRDPGQAKVLAYTAESIRAQIAASEFYAVTEVEPRPEESPRHRFVVGLLEAEEIRVAPLARLPELANRLKPTLQ